LTVPSPAAWKKALTVKGVGVMSGSEGAVGWPLGFETPVLPVVKGTPWASHRVRSRVHWRSVPSELMLKVATVTCTVSPFTRLSIPVVHCPGRPGRGVLTSVARHTRTMGPRAPGWPVGGRFGSYSLAKATPAAATVKATTRAMNAGRRTMP